MTEQPAAPAPKKRGIPRWAWIAGVILVLIAAASLNKPAAPTPAGTATNPPAPTAGAPAVTANAGPVTLLDLSGSGIKNTQAFTTTGPWTIAYSYDCSGFAGGKGNFIVSVADNSGGTVGLPVNELGTKASSSSQVYDTGTLHLEVNSECSWHVTATQP